MQYGNQPSESQDVSLFKDGGKKWLEAAFVCLELGRGVADQSSPDRRHLSRRSEGGQEQTTSSLTCYITTALPLALHPIPTDPRVIYPSQPPGCRPSSTIPSPPPCGVSQRPNPPRHQQPAKAGDDGDARMLTCCLGECKKTGRILASFVDPKQAFGPDKVIPPQVLANAKGLAILTVLKAGFLGSGRFGSGVVVARLADGSW